MFKKSPRKLLGEIYDLLKESHQVFLESHGMYVASLSQKEEYERELEDLRIMRNKAFADYKEKVSILQDEISLIEHQINYEGVNHA
jgi:hypothetical protein